MSRTSCWSDHESFSSLAQVYEIDMEAKQSSARQASKSERAEDV